MADPRISPFSTRPDRQTSRRTFLKQVVAIAAAVPVGASLAACQASAPTGQAAPAATVAVQAPVLASLSGADRDRVTQLIQAARAENQLTWLDAVVAPATATAMAESFKQKYGLDAFKMNFERLQTGQVTQRVQEEVTADKITSDTFGVASPRFFYDLRKANALLQYSSPESQFYQSASKAGLPKEDGYWMSPVTYTFVPVTNASLFSKTVKSWYDIVDPTLNGKLDIWNVQGGEAPAYHYMGLRSVLPVAYFQQLAENGPLISTGSSDQEQQKLARGEIAAVFSPPFRLTQTAKQYSATLNAFYPDEGTTMLGHSYGIAAKAPHPNTARLFMDYLLSEEGQTQYVTLEGIISARDGLKVPPDVGKYTPALSDIKSLALDWANIDSKAVEAARSEWAQIFKR